MFVFLRQVESTMYPFIGLGTTSGKEVPHMNEGFARHMRENKAGNGTVRASLVVSVPFGLSIVRLCSYSSPLSVFSFSLYACVCV